MILHIAFSPKILAIIATAIIFTCFACGDTANDPATPQSERVHPNRLFTIDNVILDDAEKVMVQGLQGMVTLADGAENIWINVPGGYRYWLDDLEANYGVVLDYRFEQDPWGLADYFRTFLSGYVLYDLGDDSENVATSVAGLLGLLPVDSSLVEKCQSLGLAKGLDVRGKDESWCLAHYGHLTNPEVVVHQREDIHGSLRDYAVAAKAFTFYDGNTAFIREVFGQVAEGGMVLGWGRDEEFPAGEWQFVEPASESGLVTIASDWAHNLSVLSQFECGDIRQKHSSVDLPAEADDVHYVTFIMSDGDNLQWLLGDFATADKWYGSNLRGDFPIGWTISPSMIYLCPTVMKWYYEQATPDDYFISGVSGRGYFYPSSLPDIDAEAARMNSSLRETDLHTVCILDRSCNDFSEKYLKPYAAQPEVTGGFWACYDDYAERAGEIRFVDGKPFAAVRFKLWGSEDDTQAERIAEAQRLAESINKLPSDSHSPLGYTVVNVHPWSKGLDDIKAVVDRLDSDVCIVSPEQFLKLLKENAEYLG